MHSYKWQALDSSVLQLFIYSSHHFLRLCKTQEFSLFSDWYSWTPDFVPKMFPYSVELAKRSCKPLLGHRKQSEDASGSCGQLGTGYLFQTFFF